ncbi:MAG: glycosyltransferase family 4 protein [Gemmatimonadetes bacterium]|nr:glycosyltransferase family 4 protein [Gemmatimonadota bacterium]
MRAVHVITHVDPHARDPEALLAAWPTLADVAEAVAHAGVTVDVILPSTSAVRIERNDVRFTFVAAEPAGRLRRRLGHWAAPIQLAVERAIAGLDPDVVHFHSLSFPRHLARLADLLPHTPVLVQDHGDRLPPPWLRFPWREAMHAVDAVAFTAAAQAVPWHDAGILPRDRPVLEIPESSTRFSPGPLDSAREITGIHGDPCLVWTGHLDANKDPLTVLNALAEASRSLPDAQLWMAFRTPALLAAVQQRIRNDDRLRGRVHLLGPQSHERIELLLRAADFLVQASHREGSGYAVIEALACGATPMVTSIPSFRALTADGEFGGLSAPGDALAMAQSLIEWSGRDRALLRARARAHFEQALSFERIGILLRDAYATLIERERPRAHRRRTARTAGTT